MLMHYNYDISANQDDGSCEDILAGCTDPLFLEYDVNANTQSFDSDRLMYIMSHRLFMVVLVLIH